MSSVTRTGNDHYHMSSKELLVYLDMMQADPARAFCEIFHLGRNAGYQEARAEDLKK